MTAGSVTAESVRQHLEAMSEGLGFTADNLCFGFGDSTTTATTLPDAFAETVASLAGPRELSHGELAGALLGILGFLEDRDVALTHFTEGVPRG